MKIIYTIGHSSYETEYFLTLLKKYEINCVVDIRGMPYSKYVPQYNKEPIKKLLQSKGIYCIYMGTELGIIQSRKDLLDSEGYLDFDKMKKSSEFRTALSRILDGLEKGYTIAVMCTEKDPIDCHRSILICRELHSHGCEIRHIMPDGTIETQEQLEAALVNMYFKNSLQESLFHVIKDDTLLESRLDEAYRKRNRDLVKKL